MPAAGPGFRQPRRRLLLNCSIDRTLGATHATRDATDAAAEISPGLPGAAQQLADGRFADGLPGELHLVREFGVARVTVRRALELLAADGLIQRAPGRGTVALAPAPPGSAKRRRRRSARISPACSRTSSAWACAPGSRSWPARRSPRRRPWRATWRSTPGHRCRRRCGCARRPPGRCRTSRPTCRMRWPAASGGASSASARCCCCSKPPGVEIGRAHQQISARLADAIVARSLGVDVGSALLAVNRLVYDTRERPVQWLQGLYRPDRYQYDMQPLARRRHRRQGVGQHRGRRPVPLIHQPFPQEPAMSNRRTFSARVDRDRGRAGLSARRRAPSPRRSRSASCTRSPGRSPTPASSAAKAR